VTIITDPIPCLDFSLIYGDFWDRIWTVPFPVRAKQNYPSPLRKSGYAGPDLPIGIVGRCPRVYGVMKYPEYNLVSSVHWVFHYGT
jgi:hypothetical protein